MTDKPRLFAWLATYHSDLLGRELTTPERVLVEEAMLDYMLDEPSLGTWSIAQDVETSLETIQLLIAGDGVAAAKRISAAILGQVRELEGRLERQEVTNDRMREHLTMLAEQKRQDNN